MDIFCRRFKLFLSEKISIDVNVYVSKKASHVFEQTSFVV